MRGVTCSAITVFSSSLPFSKWIVFHFFIILKFSVRYIKVSSFVPVAHTTLLFSLLSSWSFTTKFSQLPANGSSSDTGQNPTWCLGLQGPARGEVQNRWLDQCRHDFRSLTLTPSIGCSNLFHHWVIFLILHSLIFSQVGKRARDWPHLESPSTSSRTWRAPCTWGVRPRPTSSPISSGHHSCFACSEDSWPIHFSAGRSLPLSPELHHVIIT